MQSLSSVLNRVLYNTPRSAGYFFKRLQIDVSQSSSVDWSVSYIVSRLEFHRVVFWVPPYSFCTLMMLRNISHKLRSDLTAYTDETIHFQCPTAIDNIDHGTSVLQNALIVFETWGTSRRKSFELSYSQTIHDRWSALSATALSSYRNRCSFCCWGEPPEAAKSDVWLPPLIQPPPPCSCWKN